MSLATLVLLAAAAAAHAQPAADVTDGRPRVLVLDVRGPASEAVALRATLQELTARRGLALLFEPPSDDQVPRGAASPWATLSVELAGSEPNARVADRRGSTLALREGAGGRLRLHRVVPASASRAVTIEALATIASTALEALAREESPPPAERPSVAPRARTEHIDQGPGRGERTSAEPDVAPEPPKVASPAETPAPAEPIAMAAPPPDALAPANIDSETLTVSTRASAPTFADGAVSSSPVRFSVVSFAGYEAGNVVTGEHRTSAGAWGMGLGVAGAVTRWPLAPALCVTLGSWHGTGSDGGSGASDGVLRPVAVPQLQGHGELRLTVARLGRFSVALGPWLTVTRATWDDGFVGQMQPRGPGPNQGPAPNQGADPNAGAPYRVTRTELSGGLAARVEAELGGRVSVYMTFAGTTPFTDRSLASDDRAGADRSPTGTGETPTGTRLTLSAFGGLSVAFTGERRGF